MQDSLSNKTIERLKYDLVRDNLISYENMSKAEDIALSSECNLAQVIISQDLIDEKELLSFIENKLKIPYVNLNDYSLDKKCIKLVSIENAKKYRLIPLFKIENVLTVAMADPLDLFALNTLIDSLNCKIEPIICSESSILKAIEEYYPKQKINISEKTNKNDYYNWQNQLHQEQLDGVEVKKLIESILYQALIEKVIEIDLAPVPNGLSVEFKQHNKTLKQDTIPALLAPMFLTELKIISNLDPNICEIPQVGKFFFSAKNKNAYINTATFSTIKGERVSIKIYTKPESFDSLAISPANIEFLKNSISKPGLILVCGASLSGKTSIIYSILSSIQDKKVICIESIVKYELENVIQTELNEKAGLNLEKAMDFVSFQSPDIIYIEKIFNDKGIAYVQNLIREQKTILTEVFAQNVEELIEKAKQYKFLKDIISCIIFVHDKEKIDVITDIEKLL